LKFLDNSYKPSLLFRSGHFNTIFPYFFRNTPEVSFTRERIDTPDGDFLDLDWLRSGQKRLAVLCHGLEGSSESKYIGHLAKHLSNNQLDVLALNYRSCSGEINKTAKIYHSGATDDIDHILKLKASDYSEVYLIGFSLGANMILKYVGEEKSRSIKNLEAVLAISAPCDLEGGSYVLKNKQNRLYTKNFLKSLKAKAKIKHEQFPELFDLERILASKNVFEFDDRFTAPIHGFGNAINYYRTCSSIRFLKNIELPTLIINAWDDSFLSESCYPFDEAGKNKHIDLRVTKYGGHVGFVQTGTDYYWHELEILDFLKLNVQS